MKAIPIEFLGITKQVINDGDDAWWIELVHGVEVPERVKNGGSGQWLKRHATHMLQMQTLVNFKTTGDVIKIRQTEN